MIDHQAARDRAAESAYPSGGVRKDAHGLFGKPLVTLVGLPIGTNGLRPDWQCDAACAGMGTTLFFSDKGDNRKVAEAKAICDTCVVVDDCLQWAIDTGSRIGVFGGLTPKERQGMKLGKGVRVVRCGTMPGCRKHLRNGETPCLPCAEARREYNRLAQATARRRGRVA